MTPYDIFRHMQMNWTPDRATMYAYRDGDQKVCALGAMYDAQHGINAWHMDRSLYTDAIDAAQMMLWEKLFAMYPGDLNRLVYFDKQVPDIQSFNDQVENSYHKIQLAIDMILSEEPTIEMPVMALDRELVTA